MIHIIRQAVTPQQLQEMLEVHEHYVKVAVDIQQEILAGGGEFHADCKAALVEEGSHRQGIWGADWIPGKSAVRFGALINIRPKINPGMEIQDAMIRQRVEQVIRRF